MSSMAAIQPAGHGSSSQARGNAKAFPAGMRILVVDDCRTSLDITKIMLSKCDYYVTGCAQAAAALSLLREHKGEFDLVITDIHMPGMDGYQLLQAMTPEIDVPVVVMSGDDRPESIIKAIRNGACDYLIKPGCMGQFGNIWQHVYRKKLALRNKSRREGEGAEIEAAARKKPRVKWTPELHKKFSDAVGQLGVDKAVPKKILQLMDEPNLTKEHIASHLQKFRAFIKKKGGQYSARMAQEILAAMNAGLLQADMDIGEGSGAQNEPILPQLPPILHQEPSHPLNLQASYLPSDQPPSTFQVAVQPQECANFQPPIQPVSNYRTGYNPGLIRQAANRPITITENPDDHTIAMGQMPPEGLNDVNMMQNYSVHEPAPATGINISPLGGLQSFDMNSPWPGMGTSDQGPAQNLGFVGEGASAATYGAGSQSMVSGETMGHDFIANLMNTPEDNLGPGI